jgi:hypothetical protein
VGPPGLPAMRRCGRPADAVLHAVPRIATVSSRARRMKVLPFRPSRAQATS